VVKLLKDPGKPCSSVYATIYLAVFKACHKQQETER